MAALRDIKGGSPWLISNRPRRGQKCRMFSTLSDLQVEADARCCIRESLGAGQTPSGQVLLNNFSDALALASAVLRQVGGTYESENRNE